MQPTTSDPNPLPSHTSAAGPGEEEAYGITSCVLEETRPFHPTRLGGLLHRHLELTRHVRLSYPKVETSLIPGAWIESDRTLRPPFYRRLWALLHPLEALPPTDVCQGGLSRLPGSILRSKGFFWVAGIPQVGVKWKGLSVLGGGACQVLGGSKGLPGVAIDSICNRPLVLRAGPLPFNSRPEAAPLSSKGGLGVVLLRRQLSRAKIHYCCGGRSTCATCFSWTPLQQQGEGGGHPRDAPWGGPRGPCDSLWGVDGLPPPPLPVARPRLSSRLGEPVGGQETELGLHREVSGCLSAPSIDPPVEGRRGDRRELSPSPVT